MKRSWTCQGCKAVWPARKQRCDCGRKKHLRRPPAHRVALEMSYEDYVERYGEVCGICGKPPAPGKRLHRDHDHATGQPRGLLCFRDNTALRTYLTADWLRAAIAYLERGDLRPADSGSILADVPDQEA